MCDPKIIEKIDNGKAMVVSKVASLVWLAIVFTAMIIAFTTTKIQAINNTRRLTCIEKKYEAVDEIYFNLRHLFEENDWTWIDKKE